MDIPSTFAERTPARQVVDLYVDWLNNWNMNDDAISELTGHPVMGARYKIEDFWAWIPNNEDHSKILATGGAAGHMVQTIRLHDGDDGGYTILIAHFTQEDDWELRSIIQFFDLSTNLIWADGKFMNLPELTPEQQAIKDSYIPGATK